jgi:hypothetical protein
MLENRAENDEVRMSRGLARRRTLLQLLGAVLIGLAGMADALQISEATLRATPLFFLTLGVIVFFSGLLMRKPNSV